MNVTPPEFVGFPKMARLSRECWVTEKIDGSNAHILITEDGGFFTGSRTRWITPESDNYGFARWAHDHKDELLKLGPGHHFGEYWGAGIQRRYGLTEKRFSLFNVRRWAARPRATGFDLIDLTTGATGPNCCHVVPLLYRGEFCTVGIRQILWALSDNGSHAAPGFADPEGIVVYHEAGKVGFKKTILNDEKRKSEV